MTTFTDKELIKEIKERIGSLDVRDNIERRAYEIALESMEAEPVAYIFKHPAGKLFWALTDESNKEQADVIPVYAAPSVPVVPEEKPMPNPLKMYAVDAVAAIAEVRGWNACRAAMIQGANPVQGWIPCSDRMPEFYFPVLVTDEHEDMAIALPVYLDAGGRSAFQLSNGDIFIATHWMPLPAEPQQEADNG